MGKNLRRFPIKKCDFLQKMPEKFVGGGKFFCNLQSKSNLLTFKALKL